MLFLKNGSAQQELLLWVTSFLLCENYVSSRHGAIIDSLLPSPTFRLLFSISFSFLVATDGAMVWMSMSTQHSYAQILMLNTMALGGFGQYLCNEVRSLMNEISVLYKRDLPELPSTFHHVRIQEVYDLKEG